MRTEDEIESAVEELSTARYSIETQAKMEALLWALGHIDVDHCPRGAADDKRLREITGIRNYADTYDRTEIQQ